ncbi:dynein axonemal heavy chain 6-like [Pungitius pungitius]|uniref:dynein axonemal heavy chain 6-like n=1 Tax=Pungitius pungitius TaxID=134920 RepID=UPI002E11D155
MIQKIKESFQFAFDAAKVYSDTFERFRMFYKEYESLNRDEILQKNHALKLQRSVHKDATAIQQKRHLGLLLVDKTQLKERLVYSQPRQIQVMNEIVPMQARKKLDALLAEICDAQYKLVSRASTIAELANSVTFLDEIQKRVTGLKAEQETISQMYSLTKMYSIPLSCNDMVGFASVHVDIDSLLSSIIEAEFKRDSTMEKLGSSLQKEINELNHDLQTIKLKSQDLLDINADSSKVRLLLGEVKISIDELQARAHAYTSYQKQFKMEVTKFDALDEEIAEFRLKQLLWDCLEKWDSLSDEWTESTLDVLDLEQFSSQVTTYSKYVNQLEKGLPLNNVVPILKEKVEVTKERLHVITALLNPNMKPEHWKTLESVMGIPLNKEELSMVALEELNIFSYGMEIQEVVTHA